MSAAAPREFFNPSHDSQGRFATRAGARADGGGSAAMVHDPEWGGYWLGAEGLPGKSSGFIFMSERPQTKLDENGREVVFWKGIYDTKTGEHRIWTPDDAGWPHHSHIADPGDERMLGKTHTNPNEVWLTGWSSKVDYPPGLADTARWLVPPHSNEGVVFKKRTELLGKFDEMALRHRKDFEDAIAIGQSGKKRRGRGFAERVREYFNPNHDSKGRFASGSGVRVAESKGAPVPGRIKTDELDQHVANLHAQLDESEDMPDEVVQQYKGYIAQTAGAVKGGVDDVAAVHRAPAGTPETHIGLFDFAQEGEPNTHGRSTVGERMDGKLGAYIEIDYALKPEPARMTTTHEIGHVIDFGLEPSKDKAFTDVRSPAMDRLMDEWAKTPEVSSLRGAHMMAEMARDKNAAGYIRYALSPAELFARSYAQWIQTKRNDPKMKAYLRANIDHYGPMQWRPSNFKGIGAALDDLFKERGLLKGDRRKAAPRKRATVGATA